MASQSTSKRQLAPDWPAGSLVSRRKLPRLSIDVNLNASRSSSIGSDTDIEREEVFPMFVAMAKTYVTMSGFTDLQVRADIVRKVLTMSSEFDRNFNSQITHVIAAHSNTDKVREAQRRDLTIVSLEWLERLWSACQNNPYMHVSNPQFRDFKIPLFYNLHFYFSDFYEKATTDFYEALVITHGGRLTKLLKNTPAYFYICENPEESAPYLFAQNKHIAVVPVAWIADSVNSNVIKNTMKYPVYHKPSTPKPVGFGETFDVNFGGDAEEMADEELEDPFDDPPFEYDNIANCQQVVSVACNDIDDGTSSDFNNFGKDVSLNNTVIEVGNEEDTDESFSSTLNTTVNFIDCDDDDNEIDETSVAG